MDTAPKIRARVSIHAGLYNGRKGEIREVDHAARTVRVWTPGLLPGETVTLRWQDVRPLAAAP